MEAYISMIAMFGCNFNPKGWQMCNGQIMPIASNTALFSLLGTTFGGNGQTTFGLPDLRGRVPMHWGTGNGLSPKILGEMAGTESIALSQLQLPNHTHGATATSTSTSTSTSTLHAESTAGSVRNPQDNMLGGAPSSALIYAPPDPANDKTMAPGSVLTTTTTDTTTTVAVQPAGAGQPFSLMQPFLAVTFCICTEGLYPSRN